MPPASAAIPAGELKIPIVSFSVLTFQKQEGCALKPPTEQANVEEQDAFAAAPPAQYAPMGQGSVALGEVEPAGQ